MLFDPKWDQQTKADPFTLESLIAWLETMPPTESYCYFDGGDCLLTRYLPSPGFRMSTCSMTVFTMAANRCPAGSVALRLRTKDGLSLFCPANFTSSRARFRGSSAPPLSAPVRSHPTIAKEAKMADTKDLPALAWSGHCVYGDDASIKAVQTLVRTADRVAALEDEIKQLRRTLRDEQYQGGQDWAQMAADVDYGRGR